MHHLAQPISRLSSQLCLTCCWVDQRNHEPQAADDVYAFGVVLWEMFSCIEYVAFVQHLAPLVTDHWLTASIDRLYYRPYAGLNTKQVVQAVAQKRVLPPPIAMPESRAYHHACPCPLLLYNLMLECWNTQVSERPPISTIVELLKKPLGVLCSQGYVSQTLPTLPRSLSPPDSASSSAPNSTTTGTATSSTATASTAPAASTTTTTSSNSSVTRASSDQVGKFLDSLKAILSHGSPDSKLAALASLKRMLSISSTNMNLSLYQSRCVLILVPTEYHASLATQLRHTRALDLVIACVNHPPEQRIQIFEAGLLVLHMLRSQGTCPLVEPCVTVPSI